MNISDILNIIAIIITPIIAVVVGQYLQDKAEKRKDKVEIFKTLMVSRGLGWTYESVRALNTIEVIFAADDEVINQWHIYYDRLCVENPTDTDMVKIKTEGDKLLITMAESLGYKDKITWETIQKPYIPNGMAESMNRQQRFTCEQQDAMAGISAIVRQLNVPSGKE